VVAHFSVCIGMYVIVIYTILWLNYLFLS